MRAKLQSRENWSLFRNSIVPNLNCISRPFGPSIRMPLVEVYLFLECRLLSSLSVARYRSNLDHSAVYEEFDARNVAGVIGGEEDDCFGNLVGMPHAAERNLGC
jgi:hypothetical protein